MAPPHPPNRARPQLPPASTGRSLAALLCVAASVCSAVAQNPPPRAADPTPAHRSTSAENASLAEYRDRLDALDRLVAACQSAIAPAHCDSSQVGPDIRIPLPGGPRQVRFAWLRRLLDAAAKFKPAKPEIARPSPSPSSSDTPVPTLPEQLAAARSRLAQDLAAISALASPSAQPSSAAAPAGPGKPQPAASQPASPERQTLNRILEAREFHPAVARRSLWDQFLEKAGNWIDSFLGKLEQAGFHSRWVGIAAEILFVLALCVALVWFLIRLERQGRLASSLLRPGPGSGAASARDWQLWLEDARQAASRAAWRDAIHLLYWASISRLESMGLWPADRARTPREYLALLAPGHAQRPDLAALTRSFERTWYAGRAAEEAEFRRAAELAARLGIPSNSGWEAR